MEKNRIRLSESQLHRVIKESIKRVQNEDTYGDRLNMGLEHANKFKEIFDRYTHSYLGHNAVGNDIKGVVNSIMRRTQQAIKAAYGVEVKISYDILDNDYDSHIGFNPVEDLEGRYEFNRELVPSQKHGTRTYKNWH